MIFLLKLAISWVGMNSLNSHSRIMLQDKVRFPTPFSNDKCMQRISTLTVIVGRVCGSMGVALLIPLNAGLSNVSVFNVKVYGFAYM